MVRSEDEPPAEGESGVDEEGAEEESEHGGEGLLERDDEHVVGAEEAEVPEHAEPDKEVARPEEDAAQVPHVVLHVLVLHELLDDGSADEEHVVHDDEDVPEVEELQPVVFAQSTVEMPLKVLVRLLF